MKYRQIATILLHIIGWGLFLTLPYLLRPNPVNFHYIRPPLEGVNSISPIYLPLITNALVIPFFYLNLFIFFPRYIPNKKYAKFILSQLAAIALIYLVKDFIFNIALPDSSAVRAKPGFRDFFFVFTYLFIMLLAFSYGMIRENTRKEQIEKDKQHDRTRSELQFLRWQVNPHFLFNALNNIVSLARMKSDKLEPVLIKLATLMRYMLYETSESKITLSKEIEYLKSYIELQSLRHGHNMEINVDFSDVSNYELIIEPMLLIPIIENAFKHGTGLIQSPYIDILMTTEKSTLHFVVKNKYLTSPAKNNNDTSGIGLFNLKRRLELIYSHKYMLSIEADEFYIVHLKIDLC